MHRSWRNGKNLWSIASESPSDIRMVGPYAAVAFLAESDTVRFDF